MIGIYTITCYFFLMAFLIPATPAKLPPVAKLIAQLEAACKAYEEEHKESSDWPLLELVKAKAYAGDYDGAVRAAQGIDGIWKAAALIEAWTLRLQMTGIASEFPTKLLDDPKLDEASIMAGRQMVARALAKAGRLTEAAQFLPKEEQKATSILQHVDFNVFLATEQSKRGDQERAATSLLRCWDLMLRTPERQRSAEHLDAMAKLWMELGNRDRALAASEMALERLRAGAAAESPHRLTAAFLARVATLLHSLGKEQEAHTALDDAVRVLEAWDRLEKEDRSIEEWLASGDYAKTLAQIGVAQHAAGMKEAGAANVEKALARVRLIKESLHHDATLRQIITSHAEAGKYDDALQLIDRMHGDYWKVLGYVSCATALPQAPKQAPEWLAKAKAVAANDKETKNLIDGFLKVAEAYSKLGDEAGTKRCLDHAATAANKLREDGQLQWVARAQVRLGQLEGAYNTIQVMKDVDARLLPLAELTREAAKREAEQNRTSGR